MTIVLVSPTATHSSAFRARSDQRIAPRRVASYIRRLACRPGRRAGRRPSSLETSS